MFTLNCLDKNNNYFMKTLKEFMLMIVMLPAVWAVNAFGYQVLWNEVVLNIWQLFSTGDIINTMRISYGACIAIAVAIPLIWNPKSKEVLDVSEAAPIVLSKIITKFIMILLTLLVTSIVF